ncbi:MAG: TaqI-like C-terminal specificity domain-containing protein [Myxococcales bacterium]
MAALREDRRSRGAFYTPEALARRLAEAALRPLLGAAAAAREPGRPLRVVDPACGDGAFLRAARELAPGATLLGVDSAPAACAEARARGLPVEQKDALLDPLPGGFDVLLANPPYLSVKRAPFSPDYLHALAERYRTARGQFDACALFVERALSLLRPGGRYALLLPRPVLGNREHEPVRRLLFEQAPPERLLDLGEAFEGAAVEIIGLVGTRRTAASGAKPVQLEDAEGWTRGSLSRDEWAAQPSLRLPLRARAGELALRAKLEASGRTLGGAVAALRRGVEIGQRDPALKPRPAAGLEPVLRGRDVSAFHCEAPERFLDPSALPPSRLKDLALYRVPSKILVRRVAAGIIAAVDPSGALALNTLYCLHPQPGVEADALAGLLSSRLATFWWRAATGGDDRLFPYVRAEDLAALPLPERPLDPLAPLARRAARGEDVRQELDRAAASLYRLTSAERALVSRP